MAIVKVLATLRAKEAIFRHQNELMRRYFRIEQEESSVHSWSAELKQLLPSRRQWSRPRHEQRGENRVPKGRVLRDSIYRKVQGLYVAGKLDSVEWGCRLQAFVKDVKRRIENDGLAFQEPKLWARRKSRSDKGRCISSYENLSDYVIMAITNKYLSSQIDPTFTENSYAYRISVKQTYNKAVSRLVKFRKASSQPLYVANCDVQKLFDVIDHDVIMQLLRKRVADLDIDSVALVVVAAYLKSYSYELVERKMDEISVNNNIEIDMPDWKRVGTLHGYATLDKSHFGIPQGGTLSGLLVNLVLDEVDRAIPQLNDKELFYARYCDDIIIVHSSREKCLATLDTCIKKLCQLKLPVHEIVQDPQYGVEFYGLKSKGPYEWNNPTKRPSIPWVPFLGYNIRFDGNVRIRKETISKHIESLRIDVTRFISSLCNEKLKAGISIEDAVAGFMGKIIRKSTGNIYAGSSRELGYCWMTVFQNVWLSPPALRQLKYVDKKLTALISMMLEGLGLKFSFVHVGKRLSHIAVAKAINKRAKKNNLSYRNDIISFRTETLEDEGSLMEWADAFHEESWHERNEDEGAWMEDNNYWPDDYHEVSWYERNIVVMS